jgi:toxin ParE1/3/4
MAELIWTAKAIEQIEEIGLFIEKDSPFQARRVVQLIIKETRKLKKFSHFGKMIPETQEDKYREIRVFSYRVLYKIINENQIVVLGVVHGYRLFDSSWLE